MKANSSIYHDVPIKIQRETWACWYTSLQMVVSFYRRTPFRAPWLVDPSEDEETRKIFAHNQGIGTTSDERERVAKKLGFNVGYVSLSADGVWGLLRSGPVIYAGHWPGQASGHWVVIVGISKNTIVINNPAVGSQTWDYNFFAGQYLLQSADRPLIYADA